MYESPHPLEELCLDAISDNIEIFIEPVVKRENWRNYVDCEGKEDHNSIKKYIFKDQDIFLINEISERLLVKLLQKRRLSDATLNIFSEQNTKLKSVKINNCKVSEYGLKILKEHKVSDLECVNLCNISIGNIIDCLSEWSLMNLTSVNFSKCKFIDSARHNYMVKVINLKNLRSLNLSYTELNQHCFVMICEDLKFLEKLDISGTCVEDLTPLLPLSNQLRHLGLADLPQVHFLVSVVLQMNCLVHLDLSLVNKKLESLNMDATEWPVEILENCESLPNLKYLEISGWKNAITRDVMVAFIDSHRKLEYLGIVLSDLTFDPSFNDVNDCEYPSHLVIGGLGNEYQVKVTLQKYKEKASYVQKALYHLFQLTNCFQEPSPDLFNLVLPVMSAHSSEFGVQMAATACLYNLTKGDLSKHFHPNSLGKGINLTLDAMANFSKEFQLQKNSLLTLCNDRILQEVNFDRFRCAGLVLDALCAFSDNNTNRMAVAICSILAAKISTSETSKLGARPVYMRKLLDMVENRVENQVSDITLKFTLSALWNLTDESPATCTVFLEQRGAFLFLKVLKKFKDDSTIETKVLGLLNNIAEVAKLRFSLMLDSLIGELFLLLKSENIDVSYFAAGIVAHLASDGCHRWTASSHSRADMLAELEKAIMQWKVPDSEMVAYRSFKPFFPLLVVDMDHQVQLWAVWAVHHVCTKNPTRYCAMLREEKGDKLLDSLVKSENSHAEIRRISSQVVETLNQHLA